MDINIEIGAEAIDLLVDLNKKIPSHYRLIAYLANAQSELMRIHLQGPQEIQKELIRNTPYAWAEITSSINKLLSNLEEIQLFINDNKRYIEDPS